MVYHRDAAEEATKGDLSTFAISVHADPYAV